MCALREPLGDTMREQFYYHYLLEWGICLIHSNYFRRKFYGEGAILHAGNYPGEGGGSQSSSGAIIQEAIVRGIILGGICPKTIENSNLHKVRLNKTVTSQE